MKQIIDPNTRENVPNLYLRGNSVVWRKEISGRQIIRAVPVPRLRDGEKITSKLIQSALSWAKKAETLALVGEWDKLEDSKRKREVCTIGELVAEYRRLCRANGDPRPATVDGNVMALLRLVRDANGKEPAAAAASVLNKDTLRAYQAAKLTELGDNDATRRTVASTVRQARSLVQPRLVQDYKVRLHDLREFREYHLGRVPAKEIPLPDAALRKATMLAARRLWLRRDPLYLVYLLAYYLGMRSDEIANAKWSWVEEHDGSPRMAIKNRPADGFRIKGVRPGNVPVAPEIWRRLQLFKGGGEYILPRPTYNGRKVLIEREFADWMTGLGWDALDTTKRAHELRRGYGSRVWAKLGKEECYTRMRHKRFDTTEKSYLQLNMSYSRRELVGI